MQYELSQQLLYSDLRQQAFPVFQALIFILFVVKFFTLHCYDNETAVTTNFPWILL